jgi:hypothetical protein
VRERVEQRVDPGEDIDLVLCQFLHHPRKIAWIGNQHVHRAGAHAEQPAADEGKHVIQRQCAHQGHLAAQRFAPQRGLQPRFGGQQVGDDGLVQQCRALAHTSGAARVLQDGGVIRLDVNRGELFVAPS